MTDSKEPRPTHLDARGHVHMVNVGDKPVTQRRAVATARVHMSEQTLSLLRSGQTAKGDVLATARIAGIMAAKKTHELIPLCHAIAIARVGVELEVQSDAVHIRTEALAHDRTGVEMEALTAASVAALTLYDMLKSVDRAMVITDVRLEEKTGGRSGHWVREGSSP